MDEQILVPFDGTESAQTALDRAFEEHPTAGITVLHVLDLSDSNYGVQGGISEDVDEARMEQARELFAKAQDHADAYDVTLTTASEVGQPATVIVEYAERKDIDQIIMGTRGQSGISSVIDESVAETVISDASAPVTVVR